MPQDGRHVRQPQGPNIVRFVSVLAKRLRALPPLPLTLPADDDWLVKIITIQDRFVLGLYRRQMKAISYPRRYRRTQRRVPRPLGEERSSPVCLWAGRKK